jgi:HK97 gp10 family phage protein
MKVNIRTSGFAELDKALAELSRSAARSTMQNALRKAGQPMADAASANAPRDTGELAGSIKVSTRIQNNVGKAEFAAVVRGGGSKADAGGAMRAARSLATSESSFAVAYVGPAKAKSKGDAIKRIVEEFGSLKQSPQPYLRPAWDAHKDQALDIIRRELGNEIIKTARRIGRGKSYAPDVKYRASIAALLAHEAG